MLKPLPSSIVRRLEPAIELSDSMYSESPARLAEGRALAKAKGYRRRHLEHQGDGASLAVEGAIAHIEAPVAAIFRLVRIGHALELGIVAHAHGIPFKHKIHTFSIE